MKCKLSIDPPLARVVIDPEPSWNVSKNNVILIHERVIDLGGDEWYSFSGPVTSDKQGARYIQEQTKIGIHVG